MLRAFGSPEKSLAEMENTDTAVVLQSWGIIFRHVADNERLYRTLFNSSGTTEFIRRIREHLTSVVKERTETRMKKTSPQSARRGVAKKQSSDIPYALAANLIIGTIGWWLDEGQKFDVNQVIVWTRKLLHSGFRELMSD